KPGLWLAPNNSGLHYDSYDEAGKRYNAPLEKFFETQERWVHITWVKQGTEYKFYRNGELFDTKPAPETVYTKSDSSYWIGKVDNFWQGEIAEVAVWNYARSPVEIKDAVYDRLFGVELGLVGYWPLNEGSGDTAKDKTARANNGIINQATWGQQYFLKPVDRILRTQQYLSLPCLNFNGKNSYVEVPAHSNPTDAVTVSVWVKSNTPNWNESGCLIEKQNAYSLHPEAGGKTLVFSIYCGGWKSLKITPEIDITQWNHYAGTFDGKLTCLYINGKFAGNMGQATQKIDASNSAFCIGKDLNSAKYFNGTVAEVQVWDRALSEKEIQKYMSANPANEPGLLGYWPLHEGAGDTATNLAKNGETGKITKATWERQVFNKLALISRDDFTAIKNEKFIKTALYFDGQNDHIVLPEMNVDYAQGFTVEAWVYYNSFKSWSRIIDFFNLPTNTDKIVFANVESTDTLALDIKRGKTEQRITADKVLETGKWMHLAATVDASGNGKLYKNGQEIKSGKMHLPESLNRTQNYIGKSHGSGDGYFDGRIAEVRVWNRARKAEELQQDMNRRLAGNETGLVGYWPLNEGSENRVFDKTSNGKHGRIDGAIWPQISESDYLQSVLSVHKHNFYIRLTDPFRRSTAQNNEEFTISFWVNPLVLNDGNFYGLMGIYVKPSLFVGPNNNALYFTIPSGNTENTVKPKKIYAEFLNNFFEAPNKWVHIAWVNRGKELNFYRNGELFATKPTPEDFHRRSIGAEFYLGIIPLVLGAQSCPETKVTKDNKNFFGQISYMSFWDRACSQEEIKANMHRRLVGNEAGLVGYWPLDEGGNIIYNRVNPGYGIGLRDFALDIWERQLFFTNEVLGEPKPLEVAEKISEEEKKTSEMQQKIAELEKQISEQKQKITELEKQNSQQAQKVTQLEQQNSQQAQKVTELEQQNSQQVQKVTQLEQPNSQQSQKVTELEQQNSAQTKKVTELEQQNSQQAQKVTELEQQNSQQAQKVTELEQQNSQQAQKVTELEQQNSQQSQKVTELEQQNSQQAQKVTELEQQNSQQVQKVTQLEQQNSQQSQKVTELEQQNSQQAQKILELENKNSAMAQENSQLKQKNSEQKKKNSELSKKIAEQEQKNSQLEKENSQLKQNNSEQEQKIADRDQKISELEQKIAELEKKNSGLEEQEQLGVTPKNGCQEVEKLQPMDLKSESYFGEEVAISGEWAIAGSRKADGVGVQDAGIAYIFQLQDRKWQQKQLLQPIDLGVGDQFGCAVAIRGEWAIVGAHKADASGIQDAGSAYVFRLENGVWQQKQKLQATGLGVNSNFGKGIAISGEWAMIGASHSQAFDVANAGAAYVFRLENGVWRQKQRLQPVDLGINQCFGHSIAISGEYAFIGGGDRYASAGIKRPGGVYIYRLENNVWQQVQKLPSPQPDDNDLFGYSVAVSGKYAFVGAVNTIVSHISSAGTVYAYQLENGVWQLKQKLQPNSPDYCSFFGASVFMSGEVAIVGSTRADSINFKDTGAAYLFHLENGVWQQKQKLQPSDLHYESYFGFCTAIDREWIFVTASWADTSNFRRVGATYIFQVQ
ncbi:hypothetical protein H6S82_10765, partial [Planktothrix sp. FACHB-1355]|uniref:LamG-like jellyroll fold domain-containing protein n=1 Tax=Planktothrix sp. FACHB-1355 TaxID=2692854 RepID=UPI0019B3E0F0|nr:hypothetical protein [Planktothrix sp. FACHB-1355]